MSFEKLSRVGLPALQIGSVAFIDQRIADERFKYNESGLTVAMPKLGNEGAGLLPLKAIVPDCALAIQ